jgi:hypothetical protein
MKKSAADHSKKNQPRSLRQLQIRKQYFANWQRGAMEPQICDAATLPRAESQEITPYQVLETQPDGLSQDAEVTNEPGEKSTQTQESTGPSNLAVQEQQKDGKLSGANPEDSKAAGATPEENSQIADGQAAAPSCQENSQIADGQEEAAVKAEDKEENEMSLEQLALVKATEAEDPLLGELAAAATGALVRQNAFVDDEDDINEFSCKKCGLSIMAEECVVKGPTELWCKECHALYTMLRRHQQWPPAAFGALSHEQQVAFFAKCRQQKEEAKASNFNYKTVRNTLVTSLKEETMRQRRVEVGGTYLPLSVYEQRGYKVDEEFQKRNPYLWSNGLNDWVYMLAETSVSEAEIRATVEAQIVEAERNVKKRKAVEMTAAEADQAERKSTASQALTEVMDLVSESDDDEGGWAPLQT